MPGEFRVFAEVLRIAPRVVAKWTLGTIEQIEPLLNKRPPLQGGKKGRISLQFRETSNDCGRFCFCEIGEALRRLGERLEISEG